MLMFIADSGWIKKTALLSLTLAIPSLLLLIDVWRRRAQYSDYSFRLSVAIWTGVTFLGTYFAWFVNVTFEKSVMFMVGWPLFGLLLALLGCVISLTIGGDNRKKLFIANALLLILALASVIPPN